MSLPSSIPVSIIIPNFNHAVFLKARIESVLNQTWQNFEVIILDDCSTDNSREIIEEYRQHPKVSCIVYNEVNSGSSITQWHNGLLLAKGEYIWIAESDDVADAYFLEKMMLLLGEENNTGIAYCRTMNIDEAGNEAGLHYWPDALDDKRWTKPYTNTGTNELRNYFLYRNIIVNASSAIFKKDKALPAIEYVLQKNMRYCGDWLFYSKMLTHTNIAYLPEVLNFQRYHPNSTRYTKTNEEELQRIAECIDCIKEVAKFTKVKINWESGQFNWIHEYSSERASLSRKMTNKFIQRGDDKKPVQKSLFDRIIQHIKS